MKGLNKEKTFLKEVKQMDIITVIKVVGTILTVVATSIEAVNNK